MSDELDERSLEYVEFYGLVRCDFDDACDRCSNPTGGSWVSLVCIPMDVTETDYYICRGCIESRAAQGWCKTCGCVEGDGQVSETCDNCRDWPHQSVEGPVPAELVESLRRSLLRFVYPFTSELKLQNCIEAALCQTGYTYHREYISGNDRVDFLVDAGGKSIALECKIAGGPSAVLEQLIRYANQDEVDAVLLVTSRHTHRFDCETLNGKPFRVAWIAGNI